MAFDVVIQNTNTSQLLAVITLLLVLVVLCLPGDVVTALKELLQRWLAWEERENTASALPTDKLVHVVLFAAAAFTSCRAWCERHGLRLLIAALLTFAAVTELLQVYVPGRAGDLADIAADSLGILMGIMLFKVSSASRRAPSR